MRQLKSACEKQPCWIVILLVACGASQPACVPVGICVPYGPTILNTCRLYFSEVGAQMYGPINIASKICSFTIRLRGQALPAHPLSSCSRAISI